MTFFTDTLGLTAPILQSPMAGSQDHRLAAAVCNAGGLGALPAAMWSPEQLHEQLSALSAATAQPFNVNFFCHTPPVPDAARLARWHQALVPYYQALGLDPHAMPEGAGRVPFGDAAAEVLEAFRPAVVSFHFGLPEPRLLQRVRAWGARVWSSATTLDEALWLQAQGVDAVIAQGVEAGGHRGMFLHDDLRTQSGTHDLLAQIVPALRVPVIAAGGIGDAAAVAAAKALGAEAVQVGTAYLCSDEATTSAVHRAALQSDQAQYTALTNLFSGRPARGIVNRVMRELGPLSPLAPAFPLATAAIAPLRAAAEAQHSGDFSPLWAGQHTQRVQAAPAAQITLDLARGWLGA